MKSPALEKKVSELQLRVAEIEAKMSGPESKGWRKISGAAKGDNHLAEALKLGSQWRKRANQEDW
ncbi:hypothetical protein [Prosthecobacter dejongeii]|uniref:Uncharacterized protein n=1 Tax=Prosthecobacter dejongeii TaxID=48465 RepID=A0A7W8DQ68_9BACT|nr:hypothetical protein [Prosthecobacter dejongeii]MBB5037641.1 hypothetical protein [Prosthecobacter dejongeii]